MGILSKILKSDEKRVYQPTNDLEHILKLTLQDERRAPDLARKIFESDMIVLGSRVSEDGIERMIFDKVPRKGEIVVLAFTSKAALQRYIEDAKVSTPKFMKINGYELAKMLQGRIGLRINRGIEVGCTLSATHLTSIVEKYSKAVFQEHSIKFNDGIQDSVEPNDLLNKITAFTNQRLSIADTLYAVTKPDGRHAGVLIAILFVETVSEDDRAKTLALAKHCADMHVPAEMKVRVCEVGESNTWIVNFKGVNLRSLSTRR